MFGQEEIFSTDNNLGRVEAIAPTFPLPERH